MRFISLLIIVTLGYSTAKSQLSKHRWDHRLVIVSSQDSSNALVSRQLEMFHTSKAELKERKLFVYQVQGNTVSTDDGAVDSQTAKEVLRKVKLSDFEVILIGLDGGVKRRYQEIVSTEELFALIDSMPMRMEEMRRKEEDSR